MRHVSTFMITLLLSLVFSPLVFAQSESTPVITIKVPPTLTLDQESTVVIEVNDPADQPIADASPEVSFSPEEGISDDVLFDCSNVDESESCDANDRGVAGVFESVFTLNDSPVTMTVNVDGTTKVVQLAATQTETPAVSAAPAALTPSSVKVGPYPSVWIILLPMALMMAVVTMFVVGTTK